MMQRTGGVVPWVLNPPAIGCDTFGINGGDSLTLSEPHAGVHSNQSHFMHSLSDISKSLNRPALYLSGLQSRFELPVLPGAGYSEPYLAFLRTLVILRTLNTPEEVLRDLWHLEKKLLQLLHVDSTGSRTWFLDSCGATTFQERRLLLTQHDLGIPLTGNQIQPGLDFSNSERELFAGAEMGEDALRVLRECLKLRARILEGVAAELPHLRDAVRWGSTRLK